MCPDLHYIQLPFLIMHVDLQSEYVIGCMNNCKVTFAPFRSQCIKQFLHQKIALFLVHANKESMWLFQTCFDVTTSLKTVPLRMLKVKNVKLNMKLICKRTFRRKYRCQSEWLTILTDPLRWWDHSRQLKSHHAGQIAKGGSIWTNFND